MHRRSQGLEPRVVWAQRPLGDRRRNEADGEGKKSACGSRIEWKALPSAENLFASAINFDAVRIPFTVACTRFIPEISPPESVDDPISAMIGIIFLALFSMPLMLFWAPVFPSIVFMSGGMCFMSAWLPVFSMALRAVAMENDPNLTCR